MPEHERKPEARDSVDDFQLLHTADPYRTQAHVGDDRLDQVLLVTVRAASQEIELFAGDDRVSEILPSQRVKRPNVVRPWGHGENVRGAIERCAANRIGRVDDELAIKPGPDRCRQIGD